MRLYSCISFVTTLIVVGISTAPFSEAADDKISVKEHQVIERQDRELKKRVQCTSLTKEQTAALVAQDWENLERLAKDYLSECKGFASPQDLSDRAVNILIANNELGRFKQAIAAADTCVKFYYGNPGCHLQKAIALFALGDRPGAIKSLDISGRIARHTLEGAKHDLERARSEVDKDFFGASVSLLESQLRRIDALRSSSANEP